MSGGVELLGPSSFRMCSPFPLLHTTSPPQSNAKLLLTQDWEIENSRLGGHRSLSKNNIQQLLLQLANGLEERQQGCTNVKLV